MWVNPCIITSILSVKQPNHKQPDKWEARTYTQCSSSVLLFNVLSFCQSLLQTFLHLHRIFDGYEQIIYETMVCKICLIISTVFLHLLHPVYWWWTQPHCWTSRSDHCCRRANRACMGPPRDIPQHSHWTCRKSQRDRQKHQIQMLCETQWNRTANGSV